MRGGLFAKSPPRTPFKNFEEVFSSDASRRISSDRRADIMPAAQLPVYHISKPASKYIIFPRTPFKNFEEVFSSDASRRTSPFRRKDFTAVIRRFHPTHRVGFHCAMTSAASVALSRAHPCIDLSLATFCSCSHWFVAKRVSPFGSDTK